MYAYFSKTEIIILLRMILAAIVFRFVIRIPVRLARLPRSWTATYPGTQISDNLLTATGIYLAGAQLTAWWLLPFFFVCLFLRNDMAKNPGPGVGRFILSEVFMLFVLGFAWLGLISGFTCAGQALEAAVADPGLLYVLLGYAICIWPMDSLVSQATRKWRLELAEIEGLNAAGKWIGRLERVLILTFVLLAHYEAIGLLITAKSILRFNDLKQSTQKKEAEYILIGTLLSFSLCILLGLLVQKLISA